MEHTLIKKNVKYLGRSFFYKGAKWFGHSGSGVAFQFRGRYLAVEIAGDNTTEGFETKGLARVAFYIDNQIILDKVIEQKNDYVELISSTNIIDVEVKIIKLSECAMSIFGIRKIVTDQEGLIKASSKKKYCVEVIGDAITCGYGIDTDINDDTFCTSTENVTKAYAYHIFQALDIDYSIVALSGYGVISGYTENGLINSFEVLPQYYDKIGFSYASPFGTLKLQDVDWDFSKFVPHVIILNLGTSDESYCKDETEKHNQFKKGYIDLLKKIRYHNDNATILCTLGIMNQGLVETMKSAVIDYTNTTNDYDVVYRILEEQKPYDGYVIDGHPSTITHKKVAKVLEKEIQGYLKYISRETPIGSN